MPDDARLPATKSMSSPRPPCRSKPPRRKPSARASRRSSCPTPSKARRVRSAACMQHLPAKSPPATGRSKAGADPVRWRNHCHLARERQGRPQQRIPARLCHRHRRLAGIHALAADTDGIDGSEDNAGAFCDGTTVARMRGAGVDAKAMLQGNNAWPSRSHCVISDERFATRFTRLVRLPAIRARPAPPRWAVRRRCGRL